MKANAGFNEQAFTQTPTVRSLGERERDRERQRERETERKEKQKTKKSETRMTASVLKQDPNR